MNKIAALFLASFIAVVATVSRAVIIEGYTSAGNFQTVGVTADGRLLIDISTSVAIHVIVDAGDNITVTNSTSTAITAASISLAPNTATIIYPADATRQQGFFCNDDPNGLIIHFGDSGVTNSTQKYLPYGCVTPDVPERFQGAIWGISSVTVSTSYWYTHKP